MNGGRTVGCCDEQNLGEIKGDAKVALWDVREK